MRTVACEGRCFVLSANQCMTRKNLPDWIKGVKTPHSNGTNPPNPPDNAAPHVPVMQPRRSSVVTRTEDNHEITWPSPDAKSPPPASATTHVANGFFPSPLSTTASPSSSRPQPPTKLAQDNSDDEFISPGGSCIIGPTGVILAGPLWEVEDGGILAVTVDFEDCERGRLDLDVAGSYGRGDAFRLEVAGLDISPPPT